MSKITPRRNEGGLIMPQLRCSVQTCVHNKELLCDLDTIQVGGDQAKTARETSCDSFQQRTDNGYSNIAEGSVSPLTDIDCKAVECMYNEKCKCHAGRISVEGSQAEKAESTECATFECGCH